MAVILLLILVPGVESMKEQIYLNQGITECDIGDLRVSFLDANVPREYEGIVPHFHSVFELQYVKEGSLSVKSNASSMDTSYGDFILLPPNYFHWTEKTQNTDRYALLFSLSPIKENNGGFSEYEYYTALFDSLSDCYISRSEDISFIIKKISALYMDRGCEHKIKILLSMLFVTLAEHLNESIPEEKAKRPKRGRGKSSRTAIRGMIDDYISLNYAEDGIIEKISNLLHMSRRNTSRIINELFGASLSELVIRQRMNCALGFITESDMPLSKIAEEVGYNSYSAFYKAFVKYYGSSPDYYRV